MNPKLAKFSKFFDITFWKFIMVGIANTVVGTAVMFVSYNVLHFSYWTSSALNYIIGSVLSYFLNKYFTFKSKEKSAKDILRFAVNIAVCYVAAYGVSKPIIRLIFSNSSVTVRENLAMLAGMCIFVLLNYCGQRFFVFKSNRG